MSDHSSSALTESLQRAARSARVTGTSFAYWDGHALNTAVAGLRNSVTCDPVTADTLMHIGSISKVLNAVLVLQLVDEGRIRLEDPVARHLPELRLRDMEALGRITCGMLINHTSGIDGGVLPDHGPDRERIEDAIARCADLGQLHPPGEATSYSNMATVIAGYLVQKLRDTSWYTLIKQRIYEPLAMHHALADLTDLPRFRHSVGDVVDPSTGDSVQTSRAFLPLSFAPAGSTLMMTASDLVTFGRALVNGGVGPNGVRVLSAASAMRMTTPTAPIFNAPGESWGLGWKLLPGGVLHHSGGGPGVASVLYADASQGRVLALLTNCSRHGALNEFLAPYLESWTGISDRRPTRMKVRVEPQPYVGTFESNLYRAEVSSRKGGLALRMLTKGRLYDHWNNTNPAVPLHPLGNDRFEAEGVLPEYSRLDIGFVQPDAGGRMRYLAFSSRLLVRTE